VTTNLLVADVASTSTIHCEYRCFQATIGRRLTAPYRVRSLTIYLAHDPDGNVVPVKAPSPASGLHIRAHEGELTKVAIPPDCLAFQIGEALEIATAGELRATPHCVRVGAGEDVPRDTFALFMQPMLSDDW